MRDKFNTFIVSEQCPRARHTASSPLMFESDEETDEEELNDGANGSFSQDQIYNCIVREPTKEEKILKGFQTILTGIPPPPAYTVPQLDSREMLRLWKENQHLKVDLPLDSKKVVEVKQIEDEAKTTAWPKVSKLSHFDIYYNLSSVSENLERYSVQYKERYVGVETSSCINALYTKSPAHTASAHKRMRLQTCINSPGRRLSHLARRRRAFSSANLCSVAGNKNPDKKMIMVEIKKIGNRIGKKNSVKKTKPTPKKKVQKDENTFKRALFQSPDQLPNGREAKTPKNMMQRPKRNLFTTSSEKKVNDNGKRARVTTRTLSPRKRVNRSLSFREAVADQSTSQTVQKFAEALRPSQKLPELHKQKMLWAAKYALRDEGMGSNHQLFHSCLSVLFRTCQKLWLTKVADDDKEGSTSENMLALTKKFSAFTIKELSTDCTTEHMAKVCGDILRMADHLMASNGRLLDSTTATQATEIENPNFTDSCSNLDVLNSDTINESTTERFQHSQELSFEDRRTEEVVISKRLPICSPSVLTPNNKKKLQVEMNVASDSSYCITATTQSEHVITESNLECSLNNSEDESAAKLILQNALDSNNTSPSTKSGPEATESNSESISLNHSEESVAKLISQDAMDNTDFYKQKISQCVNYTVSKCNIENTEQAKKRAQLNFANIRSNLIVESLVSEGGNSSDDSVEKDKENMMIDRLTNDCSQSENESERSASSHRLLFSLENRQIVTGNRTLALCNLNSRGHNLVPIVREPPILTAHWKVEGEAGLSEPPTSPPILVPHWDKSDSETSSSLPESIMTHWKQMSANSVNNTDKIMFDFEDTSYEIAFPNSNEEDTRASSMCAPFPHPLDDSKSCFTQTFTSRYRGGHHCGS